MVFRLVLAGLLAAFAKAFVFAPAPIRWRGLPSKRFFLAPQARPNGFSVDPSRKAVHSQRLTIRAHAGGKPDVPYFSAKDDKTISLDSTGRCVEANGDQIGDAVGVSDCTGGPLQLWSFVRRGHGRPHMIQLKDTTKCIDVSDEGGLNGAPVELRECKAQVTERWDFEEAFPLATQGPSRGATVSSQRSQKLLYVTLAFLLMAFAWTLKAIVWTLAPVERMWRWFNKTQRRVIGKHDLERSEGSLCLSVPMTMRQGDSPLIPDADMETTTKADAKIPSVMVLNAMPADDADSGKYDEKEQSAMEGPQITAKQEPEAALVAVESRADEDEPAGGGEAFEAPTKKRKQAEEPQAADAPKEVKTAAEDYQLIEHKPKGKRKQALKKLHDIRRGVFRTLRTVRSSSTRLSKALRRVAALLIVDASIAAPRLKPVYNLALNSLMLRTSSGKPFMYYRESKSPSVLLVLAHPSEQPSLCSTLANLWAQKLLLNGITFKRIHLAGEENWGLSNAEELYSARQASLADGQPAKTKELQRLVEESQYLVFVHPIFWFEVPSQLKGMLESVFSSGFAFNMLPQHWILDKAPLVLQRLPGIRSFIRRYTGYGLLRDKKVFVTRTSGGPASAMGLFRHGSTSLESSMRFCGARVVGVDRVEGVATMSPDEVEEKVLPKVTKRIGAHCRAIAAEIKIKEARAKKQRGQDADGAIVTRKERKKRQLGE